MSDYFVSLHTLLYWHAYFCSADIERRFLADLANENNQ